MRRYGVTAAAYAAMYAKQRGRCAICRGVCRTGKRLAVDHDHKTGKFRGLLCSNCNTGLGKFHDEIKRLKAAIDYLGKGREN